MHRTERDNLGERKIPSPALYGIHSARARDNFPFPSPFPVEWYQAVGITKLACFQSYRKFRDAAASRINEKAALRVIDDQRLDALSSAAMEVSEGMHFEHFIVPAVQGGAGTSINMNVNEILANRALLLTGKSAGDYNFIDPLEHSNVFQSTNDVIPTALTVAVMRLLMQLEEKINALRQKIEELERNNREKLRPGFTEMQEAVPSSFAVLFSSYNDALARDWWRVSKCIERIKQINLGGGAIGTGLSVPRYFIMSVVPELRKLTGLPVAHGENLPDTTSNLDKWVEIHATLKAHAVNLEKMSSDMRLLSSDIAAHRLITLPARQAGSSMMPGKVNPVIPEFVISSAHIVYSNDMLISSLSGQGSLELNAYLPVIGYKLIETIKLLMANNEALLSNMFNGISINEAEGYSALMHSPSVATVLNPVAGYHKASEVAALMKETGMNIYEANKQTGAVSEEKLTSLLDPSNLLKLGFSIDDL